jgi:hypothetical protein
MPNDLLPPLPSEVEAILSKDRLTVADVAVLSRHLDTTPLCLSWPSSARMLVRRFIERESDRATRKQW